MSPGIRHGSLGPPKLPDASTPGHVRLSTNRSIRERSRPTVRSTRREPDLELVSKRTVNAVFRKRIRKLRAIRGPGAPPDGRARQNAAPGPRRWLPRRIRPVAEQNLTGLAGPEPGPGCVHAVVYFSCIIKSQNGAGDPDRLRNASLYGFVRERDLRVWFLVSRTHPQQSKRGGALQVGGSGRARRSRRGICSRWS